MFEAYIEAEQVRRSLWKVGNRARCDGVWLGDVKSARTENKNFL